MTGEAPTDDPPPQVMAGGTPLIFDWRAVRWRKTRLMVALVVAAAGHLLVFYLFQVVTESPPRQAPPVRSALILSAAEPATRQLLEGAADRLPALSPPVPLEAPSEQALATLVKGYIPTWQDHRAQLKPLPGQAGTAPLPPLLAAATGVLPSLPLAANAMTPRQPNMAETVTRPWPVLSFQSGLADLPLRQEPVWPAEVLSPEWPEEGPVSFLLSVDSSGEVTSCLSLGASSGLEEEEVELLRRCLLKVKFTATSSGQPARWGWVDVLW